MAIVRFCCRWFARLVILSLLFGTGVLAFQWAKYRPRCIIICKTHNLHFSDNGAFIISGSANDEPLKDPHLKYKTPFLVWDTRTGAVVHALLKDVAGTEFFTFSKDDRYFMAYLSKGVARLVDWRSAQEWDIVTEHANERTGFTFAPRGDWFYVYDPGQEAPHLLIDVAKHQIAVRLQGNRHPAHGFSTNGDRFYFWRDKRLQAWNTQTQQIVGSLAIPTPLLFDKQGRRLVAAAADGTSLMVWDTQTFEPLATIKRSVSESNLKKGDQLHFVDDGPARIEWSCDVVFSPSGNLLATFPKSEREPPAGLLEFWEVDTGRKLVSLSLKNGSFGSHFVNEANFLSYEPAVPGRMLWRMQDVSVPTKLIDAATGRVFWDDAPRWQSLQQLNESVLVRMDDPKFWQLIDANTGESISSIAHPFDNVSRQHGLIVTDGIRMSSYDLQDSYLCLFGKRRSPELPAFLEKWLERWIPLVSGAVQVIDRKTGQVSYQMQIGVDEWACISKDGKTLMIHAELREADSGRGKGQVPDSPMHQYRFYDLHSVKPWIWAFAAPGMLVLLFALWRLRRRKATAPIRPESTMPTA